ncbi:MAG: glycosyltransferase family 2 protein, partial [Pseudomonadota bacterium]
RRSAFTVYHGHRNRIWLLYKNTPGLLYWPLAPFQFATSLVLFLHAAKNGSGRDYLRAMRDGYGGLAALRDARRRSLSARKARLGDIARALSWSPLKALRREGVLRAIEVDAGALPDPSTEG